jgi:hypothetical protein
LVIDGVVGVVDAASLLGFMAISFSIGSGDISWVVKLHHGRDCREWHFAGHTRAMLLEKAGNSYARSIPLGRGASTAATGVLTPTTGSTAIPAIDGLNNG